MENPSVTESRQKTKNQQKTQEKGVKYVQSQQ